MPITYPRTRQVSPVWRAGTHGTARLQCRWGLRDLIKVPASAKKLAQHAIKHSFWAILPALGECFHTIAIDSRRWANFVAPMLLTAPQDETASTNAGPSVRLHETHDAFAR